MPDEKSGAMRRDGKKKTWAGPKRSGPAPARHIPWPEIFKHHISVVEGHMRMLEMVQKHTVQGTGNYNTITSLVERSREMLHQSKGQSHSFIPPAHQRDQVPLGSSSESMYPGYSPAHHVYGDAALEAGHTISALRKEGREWRPAAGGPEYAIGQGSAAGLKKRPLLQQSENSDAETETVAADKAEEDEGNPYFVVDTNPTPLQGADEPDKKKLKKDKKEKKEKKDKKDKESRHENGVEDNSEDKEEKHEAPLVQTEDISREVDAKLKSKEKKESKRRRDSTEDEKVVKKLKKDKSKKRATEEGEGDGGEGIEDGEKKKRRRKAVE